jgi:hypothetical protein
MIAASQPNIDPSGVYSSPRVEQVTITQAAASKRYGITDRTLRNWHHAGRISSKRVGGLRMYVVAELDAITGAKGDH